MSKSFKILLIILIVIVSSPLALYGVFAAECGIRNFKAERAAGKKEKRLNELDIVPGQTTAKGTTSGDCLTMSSDTRYSSLVSAEYQVSGNMSSIETDINKRMAAQGFVRDGGNEKPYYVLSGGGSPPKSGDSIAIRYVRGDETVRVHYYFDKRLGCPEGYTCQNKEDGFKVPGTETYPLVGFKDTNITKLRATLGHTGDSYTVGLH